MKASILAHLPENHPWRENIHWFDSIGSTNDYAKQLALQGAPHGTTVIAGSQTNGRGRMGRSFYSPESTGIYLSVILRYRCTPQSLMHLTCAAAVAICDAVEHASSLRPRIKWTNDLVWGSKKLGGILTELGFENDGTVRYAIVGIGINCSAPADGFPIEIRQIATSLSEITGKEVDVAAVSAAMIASLHHMAEGLLARKDSIMETYRTDCMTLGREIVIQKEDVTLHGTATAIDNDGALIVTLADGAQLTVNTGEVSVRGLYGYV